MTQADRCCRAPSTSAASAIEQSEIDAGQEAIRDARRRASGKARARIHRCTPLRAWKPPSTERSSRCRFVEHRRDRHGGGAHPLPRRRAVAVRQARRPRPLSTRRRAIVIGEVVRIDDDGATVKPFGRRLPFGIGMAATYRQQCHRSGAAPSWKGRVINAHWRAGRRPRPAARMATAPCGSTASRQPAMTRERHRTPAEDRRAGDRHVHAALRRPAHRHLRRLRRRQVDAAVDARPFRRVRHRRRRAGRRARPRGARIPRRAARREPVARGDGRLDRRRERR